MFSCRTNQYIVLQSPDSSLIGPFIWTGKSYEEIRYLEFSSLALGSIKPKNKDPFQMAYFDSIKRNQFTIATGPAGSGKSVVALSYAFQELEKGKISSIYIFTNPYIAKGAVKLGYYPGKKEEKLLDLQIGNVLVSKLGSREEVERYLHSGKIEFIPMGAARGMETREESFAYFTEAQNLDIYLMKLFLQRINNNTKLVIEGDFRQTDNEEIFGNGRNGLSRAIEVFAGKDYFGHVELKTIFRSRIAADAEEM